METQALQNKFLDHMKYTPIFSPVIICFFKKIVE